MRANGADTVYMSFGAMVKDFTREDLIELYRLVMQKYGTNRPEDAYDRVLWSDLKTMFDPPLNEDAIWSLPLQQKMVSWRYYDKCEVHCLTLEACTIYMLADRKYPLSKDACQVMLKMKLLDGKMNEVCYKLLKMIEKQAGIRKLNEDFVREKTKTKKLKYDLFSKNIRDHHSREAKDSEDMRGYISQKPNLLSLKKTWKLNSCGVMDFCLGSGCCRMVLNLGKVLMLTTICLLIYFILVVVLVIKDYPIWEVIQRGNGPVSVSTDTNSLIKVLPPKTAEETLARGRERKARNTLLIALPEDHLAKFHKITDAKEMWEAIKSRFGGNDESKKMQKYILKQQFEGFFAFPLKMQIRSFLGLYLLPGLRVFESDVKGSTASSSSTQNVEFVSENTSSTNDVSIAYDVSNSSGHNSQEMDLKWQVAMISMRMKKFYKNTGRKLQFDAKEPVGFDKTKVECYNCHKTGHFARECKTKGNQDNKRGDVWNSGNKYKEYGRRSGKQEDSKVLVIIDGEGSDIEREQLSDASIEIKAYTQGLKKVEAQLVAHQQGQLWYEEKIRFIKINLDDKTDVLTYHKKLLAETQKKDLKAKVEKWHNSSKNLGKLLNTQMSAYDKFGLGYRDHRYDGILSYENEVLQSVFMSKESKFEKQPLYDRFVTAGGMHVVPPPMSGNYMPSGPDIEIDYSQFTYGPKQSQSSESETQTSEFDTCESDISVETPKLVSESVVNEPNVVCQPKIWSDAPIIEEYESDSDDNCVSKPTKEQEQPSFATVLTRTGKIPVNTSRASGTNNVSTARHNFNRQTVPTNAARKVNTIKSMGSTFEKQLNRTAALRINFSNQKVNTAEVKAVSAVGGKRETAVKPSAGCNWKPKGHYRHKDYPHRTLQNKGIVDSGCSRHMTGNKAYLAEYQDFNGGPVAFGGSKGYITGKGKIKTGKLDFEDVCFVKELQHFNLFSMSQMCDKKNKVLFTDTECLVLSPEFKLPDANQVLLRIPRQNNMYSFNLENIVPSGGLACLIAKATIDESNKWHRRLGHVNFKNLNKLVKGNLVRGLPSKIFQNDHTCVACQKGKQHKASCICLLAWMGWNADIEGRGLGELCTYDKMFSFKET
ncbi:ribonuclease H-like domain-containing protein [Tanacetum coccineum]|uniref:Ribonuclease H-like domain-containing protein n=1 Tax=Tanacetum coccineum TaxID=301880 RepID=A0ABQ4Y9I5_9ASTR